VPERATVVARSAEREVSRGHSSGASREGPNDGEGETPASLNDGMPQKSSINPRAHTDKSGEAATVAVRVAKSLAECGHESPGNDLNPLNRPVRTRMPGGVGGEEPQGSPLSRCAPSMGAILEV
jgi:hypothetical protein